MASYMGVNLDIIYGGKAMDLMSPAGMAFPSHGFRQLLHPIRHRCVPELGISRINFISLESWIHMFLNGLSI